MKKILLTLLILLCGATTSSADLNGVSLVGGVLNDPSVWNNNDYTPEPTLPTVAAGESYTDPTFGTKILRVTDGNDGSNADTAYSYWNLFNADSTKFIVNIQNGTFARWLYSFDKANFTATQVGLLHSAPPRFSFSGIIWDETDPDLLYGYVTLGTILYSHVPSTRVSTPIKDFVGEAGWENFTLHQMSSSEDNNIFAFSLKTGASVTAVGYYRVANDAYGFAGDFDFYTVANVDEAQVDKSGRYISIKKTNASNQGWEIWDLSDDSKTNVAEDATDRSPGHYDSGSGVLVGADGYGSHPADYGSKVNIRNLATPTTWTNVFLGINTGSSNWDTSIHISHRNDDSDYAFIETYNVNGVEAQWALDNEIIQITLDGSGDYRRLAHHRSIWNSGADSPDACVNKEGTYIIYTSNWGNQGRNDVFILKIP